MQVIASGHAFVVMPFTTHMHQVEFVYQAIPFQQRESPVYGNAVDGRLNSLRPSQNLSSIEMMIGSLDYPQDCPALLCKPNAFRCKLGLQPARGLT